MKRKIQFRITNWETDTEWLLKQQDRLSALGKKTIIREDDKGKFALFYKYVKDFPELETSADRYRTVQKGGVRCRY